MRRIALAAALLGIGFAHHATAAEPNVVIGYENNGADPYMVSQAQGLFQKMIPGKVSLKFFSSGPAAMSALASNSLQFMCGLGVPPFVAAVAQGVPLAVIYNQERYTTAAGIVVRPGKGINSVADLKGKRIAIVQGSQATFELAMFLQQAKLPFDAVSQVNMAPPSMRIAWTSGDIDAAIVWDPVFDALKTLGGTVLKTDTDLPRGASSYNICIANKQWVKSHPDLAADFVRALDAGVQYTQQHPQQALALMAKEAGVSLAVAKTELDGYEIFSAKDQLTQNVLGTGKGIATAATAQTIANTAKVLQTIGRIDQVPADPAAAVDSAYAARAVH